jgi:hypothetical protein
MDSDKGIDAIIRQAIERGEFDDLPGKGKPVDLSAYFNTPEDLRMAYSILKNASVMPEEVELLTEIGRLGEALTGCSDESEARRLRREIETRRLKVNLRLEQYRAAGRRS